MQRTQINAFDIDSKDAIKGRFVHAGQWAVLMADPRVVDKDVEVSKRALHRLYQFAHRTVLTNIGADGQNAMSRASNRTGYPLRRRFINVSHHHGRTMFRQISGDPLAKTTAAAGNDGHFVG